VAVVAMGVVTAPAFASLPQFVPAEGVKWPIKLEGKKSSTPQWEFASVGGASIACTSSKESGEIKGPKEVSATVELEGCSERVEGPCNSEVSGRELPEGHMSLSGNGKLVYVEKTKKTVGIILTMPRFTCDRSTIYRTHGGQVVEISPTNKKNSEIKMVVSDSKGLPTWSDYFNEAGEERHEAIEWNFGAGYVGAAMQAAEPTLTGSQQFTIEA
jgi:hypothetical protein